VTLAWDDYNDLDLHVKTPTGTEICFNNREADGGVLDVDMNGGGPSSKEPVENVFFGDLERGIEAMRGKYSVFVQNYAYHCPDRGPVPFRIYVRMNGEATEYRGETPAGVCGQNVHVVDFEYKGRTVVVPSSAPSALEASNLVAVTASVGSTLDALSGLLAIGADIDEIERTRALVQEDQDLDEAARGSDAKTNAESDADGMDCGREEQEGGGGEEARGVVGTEVTEVSRQAEIPAGRQVSCCAVAWPSCHTCCQTSMSYIHVLLHASMWVSSQVTCLVFWFLIVGGLTFPSPGSLSLPPAPGSKSRRGIASTCS